MNETNYERLQALFSLSELSSIDHMIVGIDARSIAKREMLLFGPGGIALFSKHGITAQGLAPGTRFADVSPAAKTEGIADDPQVQAAFIWPERRLYVKHAGAGVFSHELGHALDFCLGVELGADPVGIYQQIVDLRATNPGALKHTISPFRSKYDSDTNRRIGRLCDAVTPYGSTDIAESWAEAVRAYCGVNDGTGLFATVSSNKLRAVNRSLYGLVLETFIQLNGRSFERRRRTG